MRRKSGFVSAAATIVAAVLVGSGAPAVAAGVSVWTQDGYGPGNTGYNPYESDLNASTVGQLSYQWSRQLYSEDGDCYDGQFTPVVAGGRAFTADPQGIYADDAGSGANRWVFSYADPEVETATNLAVVGNVLVATVEECAYGTGTTVYGLNVANGAVLWSNHLNVNSDGLVVDKGVAAVSGRDTYDDVLPDRVSGFRVSDGALRWSKVGYRLGHGASANGRLMLNRSDAKGALVVDIASGAQVWKTGRSWSVLSASPAADRFYVADATGALVAVQPANGAVVWTVPKAAGPLSTDGRRLYVSRGKTVIGYALSGKKLWTRVYAANTNRPIRAGGILYSAVAGRPMAILNPANGLTVLSGAKFQYSVGHPVVAGGMLFVYDGASMLAYGL
ncbi:PQQ-binding-like beta-propeller repeat protein [Actinoplanes sp. NPDC051494]|uniref:outer membrane protein assembly factor BamB family protein n=1 Tax=Actinoplanes sp. NPDC051494 TaxID=3363907 RepID=UPI0037AC51F7